MTAEKDRDQTCPSWKGLAKICSLGESQAETSLETLVPFLSMLLHGLCPKPRTVTGCGWDQQTGGVVCDPPLLGDAKEGC